MIEKQSGDISKLPKWAQRRMNDLERALKASHKALKDHEASLKPTSQYVYKARCIHVDSGPEAGKRYIDAPCGINFESQGIKINVCVGHDGEIRLNCNSGKIAIAPVASNAFNLVLVDGRVL